MIINVASTGGRTHLLDTAKELAKLGHTVRFYSYVPTKRAMNYGLPKECSYTLYYWAVPFLVLFKLFGFGGWIQYIYNRFSDVFLAYYMKPCDVFIGQSPLHNYSIKKAKKKFGAVTILERGTIHALDYQERLRIVGQKLRKQKFLEWDLKGYKMPDYISVGSEQVKEGMIRHGVPEHKVFVNNYGFNATSFFPTVLEKEHYDLLMVGRWSKMKGADILTEVCKQKGYSLLHVGGLVDSFPALENMHHIDSVDEKKLYMYYSKAKVFVLPTWCEGLALVQLQAMACGLPLVCSPYSGGRDLKRYEKDGTWIFEMSDLTVDECIEKIEDALSVSATQSGKRCYLNERFIEASWDGYGKRYDRFLTQIMNAK